MQATRYLPRITSKGLKASYRQMRQSVICQFAVNFMETLEIRNLHAGIEGKEILKGVTLKVSQGEVHTIMGPNGSGKSTLSSVIMGHPKYIVSSGEIIFRSKNVLEMSADERAKLGLFLSF